MLSIAVIVDWDNFRKSILENPKALAIKKIEFNKNPAQIISFIKCFIDDKEERIYRIFFYLAEPYKFIQTKRDGTKIDFSKSPVYTLATNLIKNISQLDLTAIRRGRLTFRGWRPKRYNPTEQEPIFIQKQVDMLIGLDVAHLSYNKLVDRILLFSYDTDIQPALKAARKNGIQIVIPHCPDINAHPASILIEHSDFNRSILFKDIIAKI
jgi:uncharacterized LabA/DUF88 family protein